MAGLFDDTLIEELRAGAAGLAGRWGLSPETTVSLLTISENATFRADDPASGAPVILRVHRPDYHSIDEIRSELAWIDELRRTGVIHTPAPLSTLDGDRIASFDHHGESRHVVAFEFMNGTEPGPSDDLVEGFAQLGEISARLHQHARAWQRPADFRRKIWNYKTTVGAAPHWGDWRAALGLTGDGQALLERTGAELERRLTAFGDGADRFGLIHADLRLANLLIDGERLGVIDFDDCGFGWFVYDFAAAVSFFEHDPIIPALQDAWVEGYRRVAPLSAEEKAALPTFVMLRRLLLTAWIASHSETPTARELGPAYTDGTLELAETFLSRSP